MIQLYSVILRNVLILKLNTNLVPSINQVYTLNIMNNGKILKFLLFFASLLKNFTYIFKTTCFIHSNLTTKKKNHSRTGVKVTIFSLHGQLFMLFWENVANNYIRVGDKKV